MLQYHDTIYTRPVRLRFARCTFASWFFAHEVQKKESWLVFFSGHLIPNAIERRNLNTNEKSCTSSTARRCEPAGYHTCLRRRRLTKNVSQRKRKNFALTLLRCKRISSISRSSAAKRPSRSLCWLRNVSNSSRLSFFFCKKKRKGSRLVLADGLLTSRASTSARNSSCRSFNVPSCSKSSARLFDGTWVTSLVLDSYGDRKSIVAWESTLLVSPWIKSEEKNKENFALTFRLAD